MQPGVIAVKNTAVKSRLELYTNTSPYPLLDQWFEEARSAETVNFDAAQLATVDDAGMPNIRTVLVRSRGKEGFVFYTNLDSKKGHELASHKKAALLFYWKSLSRQLRIRGNAALVDDKEADEYFAQRPERSRVGAHVSLQSSPLQSRATLEKSMTLYTMGFDGKPIPRPNRWSGFRIAPIQIEFWEEGPDRLHDRLYYEKRGPGWRRTLLYP